MSDAERRFTSVPVEIRAGTDKRTIGGYAAKFMPAISQNLGGFKEQIRSVAFNASAAQGWPGIQARYNHDDAALLGSTGGNSLRLRVDDVGLQYDVDLLPDELSQRIYMLVERGDVRESSFAFIADEDEWTADDTGFPLRTLHQARLIDVAPVNSAAYPDATVGVRTDTVGAFRSLANKFDAPLEEVRALAADNHLDKFFKKTGPEEAPRRSAQAALARVQQLG